MVFNSLLRDLKKSTRHLHKIFRKLYTFANVLTYIGFSLKNVLIDRLIANRNFDGGNLRVN